jgi:transcriptional regulator with XRE-family HTH domain
MPTPKKLTGAEIRRIRKAIGLTQVAFAERVRLHPNSLARMERNEIRMRASTVELIRRIQAETPTPPPTGGRGIILRE